MQTTGGKVLKKRKATDGAADRTETAVKQEKYAISGSEIRADSIWFILGAAYAIIKDGSLNRFMICLTVKCCIKFKEMRHDVWKYSFGGRFYAHTNWQYGS